MTSGSCALEVDSLQSLDQRMLLFKVRPSNSDDFFSTLFYALASLGFGNTLRYVQRLLKILSISPTHLNIY
jgi:hypothetical protein